MARESRSDKLTQLIAEAKHEIEEGLSDLSIYLSGEEVLTYLEGLVGRKHEELAASERD